MSFLDEMSRYRGWRDEMVTWAITAYAYNWLLNKTEVRLQAPWRADRDCYSEDLEYNGENKVLRSKTNGPGTVLLLTVLELAAPVGCMPTWGECEE